MFTLLFNAFAIGMLCFVGLIILADKWHKKEQEKKQ